MLLHLCPRLLWPFKNAAIVDLEIRPLGLHLVGGVDLITRCPFPNKRYKIACRKGGHNKGVEGILIETVSALDEFETVARWAIEAETLVTHHVHYRVLDHDFDTASQDMTLWSAQFENGWADRWPDAVRNIAPMKAEPLMEVLPDDTDRPETWDTLDVRTGWIEQRRQNFAMPTIERGRYLDNTYAEIPRPLLSAAFHEGQEKRASSRRSRPSVPLTDDDVPF